MPATGQTFIDRSNAYLIAEYLPKIRRCVATLDEPDIWWRPNAQSNSVGNLLLHLAGNLRQWVVSGIGGNADVRNREQEFAARGDVGARELLALLENAVRDADSVLARLNPERLLERRLIQGHDVTVLDALYHAVEHFGMHTGQIIYITKLRTGKDLCFYEVKAGIATPAWHQDERAVPEVE